jgi:outer membrane lipoprotein-sorting protein
MLKKTQLCGIVIALIASSSVWAADQTIALKDGRQVILHDNFTWQYKAQTNNSVTSPTLKTTTATATAIPVIATSAVAIPIISAPKGVDVELGTTKAIQQLSDSGMDVLLTAAHYENGTLIIPTMMTNQSSKSVVNVTMKVRLSNSNGQTIAVDMR